MKQRVWEHDLDEGNKGKGGLRHIKPEANCSMECERSRQRRANSTVAEEAEVQRRRHQRLRSYWRQRRIAERKRSEALNEVRTRSWHGREKGDACRKPLFVPKDFETKMHERSKRDNTTDETYWLLWKLEQKRQRKYISQERQTLSPNKKENIGNYFLETKL